MMVNREEQKAYFKWFLQKELGFSSKEASQTAKNINQTLSLTLLQRLQAFVQFAYGNKEFWKEFKKHTEHR